MSDKDFWGIIEAAALAVRLDGMEYAGLFGGRDLLAELDTLTNDMRQAATATHQAAADIHQAVDRIEQRGKR